MNLLSVPKSSVSVKPHALVEETEQFQNLIAAVVAEFHRLQHARQQAVLENLELRKQLEKHFPPLSPRSSAFELQKQLQPHSARQSTFSSIVNEAPATDLKGNGNKPTLAGGSSAQELSMALVPPASNDIGGAMPVEAPFHMLTPFKENCNDQGTSAVLPAESETGPPPARQLAPARFSMSGPVYESDALPVKQVSPSFDFDDCLKNPDKERRALPIGFGRFGTQSANLGLVGPISDQHEESRPRHTLSTVQSSAQIATLKKGSMSDQHEESQPLHTLATVQAEQIATLKNQVSTILKSNTTLMVAKQRSVKAVQKAKTNWVNVLLDTIPACVILANACTIGMSADVEPQSDVWDVLEAVWIGFYFLEFLVKMCMFGPKKYYCGQDKYWNWFDFTCLVISLCDLVIVYALSTMPTTGGASGLLKMLRLARLLRIVRALHYSFFNELKQMLIGVVSGVRVLIWAIILLLVVIFFLGVALNSLYGEAQAELSSVPRAMLTLFRCYTDGCSAKDGTPLQERLFHEYGAAFFFGYILSFMFVTVGIFNLIMAIFIDNVVASSVKRKLHDLGCSAEKIETRIKDGVAMLIFDYAENNPNWDQIPILAKQADTTDFSPEKLMESDIAINRHVFGNWLGHKEFIELLEEADVEIAAKAELFDVLDTDMGGELSLDELTNGLMKLRGPITKSDIIAVRLKVRYITCMVEDIWRRTANVSKKSQEGHVESTKDRRRSASIKSLIDASELKTAKPSLIG